MTAYGETRDYHAIDNAERVKIPAGMATSTPLKTRFTLQVSDSLIRFLYPYRASRHGLWSPTTGFYQLESTVVTIAVERMRPPSGDDTYALTVV